MSKALWIKENLEKNEEYAGIILGKDGAPDYHLILLPGKIEDANWKDALAWTKKIGGDLPTRREQSLLFANLKEHFEARWYWSSEQNASHFIYAWGQYFDDGGQDCGNLGTKFRARAVRRLEIQSS
ncbi:MAG: hypothetical protein WC073_14030 [Sterolibacterium sp.]